MIATGAICTAWIASGGTAARASADRLAQAIAAAIRLNTPRRSLDEARRDIDPTEASTAIARFAAVVFTHRR
jgi:hypothetical protein